MKRVLLPISLIAGICFAHAASADIYRLDGDDEVVSFTDSPRNKRYQLVMKEPPPRSFKNGKSEYLAGPKKAGTAVARSNSPGTDRTLPVDGVITSVAGYRADPFNGKLRHHNGLDIAAPSGTPVKPVAPGTVIFSGWKGGYGNTVILDHHDGMVTVYAHHSNNNVSEGAVVDLQTVIALTGSTGRSTGPHLHFEAWQDGANITSDFLPGRSAGQTAATLVKAPIRRFLQADGTLLFTNLR